MSFFDKILRRDFSGTLKQAEGLAADGRLGEAVIAFNQALERTRGVEPAEVEAARRRLHDVKDDLARRHLEEGKQFADEGDLDRAVDCFETAAEAAASQELADEARALADRIEADDARAAFEEADELSEEERYEALTGTWSDDQADELDSYGEPFRHAFMALHDGRPEEAAEAMAELAEDHPDAVFLHLELGTALHSAGSPDDAIAALERFLSVLEEFYEEEEDEIDDEEDDEGRPGDPLRVRAHDLLAAAYRDKNDLEAAEKQLRALVDLLPEESEPYVVLGRFLRMNDRAEEALEVLEEGLPYMGEMRPDMRIPMEMGLAHAALGHNDEAISSLKACLDYTISLGSFNFNPEVAVPLAELYVEAGEPDRAADLYRHLAAGTHAAGHFTYNLLAGTLLMDSQEELARRHLTRALELAPDEEARKSTEALVARLDE